MAHDEKVSSENGSLRAALGGLAVAGLLVSAYLTYLEVFVVGAICQWCVANVAIMAAALVCAVRRLASLPKNR